MGERNGRQAGGLNFIACMGKGFLGSAVELCGLVKEFSLDYDKYESQWDGITAMFGQQLATH